MDRVKVVLAFLCVVFVSTTQGSKARKTPRSAEQRLISKLLENYDPRARPVIRATDVVNVSFELTLQQIVDLDEKNQLLTTSMYMGWQWSDAFLQWNPDDYDGILDIRLPAKSAWKPDILIYNSAVASFDQMLQTNVIVNHTGSVKWLPPGLFQTTCSVDIAYFPYDEQKCSIKFGTWTYQENLVDLHLKQVDALQDNFIENGEYKYLSMRGKRTSAKYECCPHPFVDITYTVHMKRNILFYGFNLILPCLLICSLTILVFVLPADAGERITLGITILLALVVFLQLVTDSLPPANVIPLLVKFFACSIIMVTLSVLATVVSLNFHHTSSANTDEMPKYIRWIFLYFLPKLLRMKRPGDHSFRRQFLDTPEANEQKNGKMEEYKLIAVGDKVQQWNNIQTEGPKETVLEDAHKHMSDILEEVKFITDRMHSDDKDERTALEWQFAATVLDKFCLYFFSLYLFIATLATLVIGHGAS